MATRRCRIKAVANVSATRGKCTERLQNSDKAITNTASDPAKSASPVICHDEKVVVVSSVCDSVLNSIPDVNVGDAHDGDNDAPSSDFGTRLLSASKSSIPDEEGTPFTKDFNSSGVVGLSTDCTTLCSDNGGDACPNSTAPLAFRTSSTTARTPFIPVKLPRKRMKPSVCLPSANRKARESCMTQVDDQCVSDKTGLNSSGQTESSRTNFGSGLTPQSKVDSVGLETFVSNAKYCRTLQEEVPDVAVSFEKTLVSESYAGTVTCSDCPNSSPSEKKPEDPISSTPVNESVKSSQLNSFRSRFIRPKPRILDSASRHSKSNSAGSASESDSEKKSLSSASTVTPPWRRCMPSSTSGFKRPSAFEIGKTKHCGSGTSADESEDECSALSMASTVSPPKKRMKLDRTNASHAELPHDSMEDSASQAKKPRSRSEQTSKNREYFRRIIEIKKEIALKVSDGKMNKSRLTMFDLIYYNPVTNPMKSIPESNGKKSATVSNNLNESEERLAEESVDEPELQTMEDEQPSSALPVPQVKVGPDGEIILDEQSLVIETTNAKKNWNNLQNSDVIMDYGNGTTTFNAYSKKRKVRGKDWNREETLRFYRALHTVGTDFLVMQSLFPKHTRRELKDRFKKEEKLNRDLVEKALRNPGTFDLTDLQKEFDLERQEEQKRPIQSERKIRRRCSLFAALDATDTGEIRIVRERSKSIPRQNRPRRNTSRKRKAEVQNSGKSDDENCKRSQNKTDCAEEIGSNISACLMSNRLETAENGHADSENETQEMSSLAKTIRPTRSGRIPRPRIFEDFMTGYLEETQEESESAEILHDCVSAKETFEESVATEICDDMPPGDVSESEDEESELHENFVIAEDALTVQQNQVTLGNVYSNVKPGTLIVLATESPDNPGHQVLRVFMVSNNSQTVPVSVADTQSSTVSSSSNPGETVNVTVPSERESDSNE